MPGDRENVVKLDADHSTVCKFGSSQIDQDNLRLVRGNIRDLYNAALKKGEFLAMSIPAGSLQGSNMASDEVDAGLRDRMGALSRPAGQTPM